MNEKDFSSQNIDKLFQKISILESELFQKNKIIQELNKTNERLNTIINVIDLAILIRTKNKFIYVSDNYETLFGIKPQIVLSDMLAHYNAIVKEDARILSEWNKSAIDIARDVLLFKINDKTLHFHYKSYPIKDTSGLVLQRIETYRISSEMNHAIMLLPLCSHCKKVRINEETWCEIEEFLRQKVKMEITHSLCPDCVHKFYGHIL